MIKQLLPVQELDIKIKNLRNQLSEKPRLLEPLLRDLNDKEKKIQEIKDEINTLKLDIKDKEIQVKEFEDQTIKLQTQALQAKKNEEYQAILKQAGSIKADKMVVEDRLLEAYMKIDEFTRRQKQDEADHTALKKQYESESARVTQECAGITRDVETIEKQRQDIIKDIDSEVLKIYERILRAQHDALVLATVQRQKISSRQKASDDMLQYTYTCGGCSVSLTTQDINMLMIGKQIMTCRSCSRILFLDTEEHTPEPAKGS